MWGTKIYADNSTALGQPVRTTKGGDLNDHRKTGGCSGAIACDCQEKPIRENHQHHAAPVYNYLMLFANGIQISTSPLAAGAWHHIAVIGNGAASGSRNIKMYLDGTLVGTDTVDYNFGTESIWVGSNVDSPTNSLRGYLDEVRVLIGEQAWTANFTPPTAPY